VQGARVRYGVQLADPAERSRGEQPPTAAAVPVSGGAGRHVVTSTRAAPAFSRAAALVVVDATRTR